MKGAFVTIVARNVSKLKEAASEIEYGVRFGCNSIESFRQRCKIS
jgi:short-subunit dehydrogenase